MVIENRFNITNSEELAVLEERLVKTRAIEMYDNKRFNCIEVGTYQGLADIHRHLFNDVYEFAGVLRDVNISKGNFQFADVRFLPESINTIDQMPQNSFDEILEKYVEMNVLHPFREGNGRALRLWLDLLIRIQVNQLIDWTKIEKRDYMIAMRECPVSDTRLKLLIQSALIDVVDERMQYMKNLDMSFKYEGFEGFRAADI